MNIVVQEEVTGCGIASVANIVGKTYSEMKAIANELGVFATDSSLWSDTDYVRRMLSACGVRASDHETPFVSWGTLPDLALLAIKHHRDNGKDFWHWVVFKRLNGQPVVLDSASYLPSSHRTDFSDMQPKWFIEVFDKVQMIARKWKAKCPKQHEEGFIAYLYETGVKDTAETNGFLGAQIFNRDVSNGAEITLITYWVDVESIKAFAGEDIGVAKLYPEDDKYELQSDHHVNHYKVRENMWVKS